ncbi:chromosome segregation protein SMC [Schinkia azotoformans]|uniref:chromosome segregation protein SMC n=1 Tax=Schinkia azotoformans TaxID=1454 RepID=UPI002DBEB556|nr:chromosome segregation protein SMC [Schinkia azotoformans]MEC1721830.1 chromosome segregation protein SMC [Schinkia azotoformans]MED4411584.1 chromosome segregation protein SMC [Schinkia azotoformans]
MHLKRLEIVGFKAFADRTSVDFVPGVTAVVGPNGSGKSNITDAIRWVLGEQSVKSLRGSKMEDIIFAGSDTRKPLNVAEVTLTLENDDQFLPIDYHEVSVTRRVYRSGESEFYINKQSCRLKDIVDLFMDSGLGREAFSIISQGKVEEILSSKSEDRRTIFEEAAGVLKYKTRKKKAEIKLFETQDNLNRVDDILHEIEGQVEPLKVQSSIAKDYLDKKEELEKTEVALTVYEIEELHGKWEFLSKQFEEHKDVEIELLAKVQKQEADMEALRENILVLDDSITELQEVLLLSSNELEKLEGQREVLKERKKNATQNRSQLEQSIEDLKMKTADYESQISIQTIVLAQYQSELQILKKDLESCEEQLLAVSHDIEGELENLKSDYIDLLNNQASLKNEKSHLDDQLKQLDGKKGRLDQDNEKYLLLRKKLEDKKSDLRANAKRKQEELQAQVLKYKQLELQLEKQRDEYHKKETQLYQAYQYLQKFRSRKEMLEEMQEDYSGFFQGVKEVLKAKLPGILGAVAELIHVEKQYETAIEIALGSAMQHVVVDHENHAREAIAFLKKHHHGRATFLPLSVIKGKTLPFTQTSMLEQHPAFIGIASSLVTYDSKYNNVIENLLGTVMITVDLKGANDLARLINHRYRIVTLEGDVVNPGGSMTGGSIKQKTTSLFTRQRELEDLVSKLPDMERKTEILEQQVKVLKEEIHENENQLAHLKEIGETFRIEEHQIKGDIRELEIEEKNINERLKLYDLEIEGFNKEKESANKKLDEVIENLARLEDKITSIDEQMTILASQKKNQQTSKEALQQKVTELKVLAAEKGQLVKNQQEQVNRLHDEKTITMNQLKLVTSDLEFLNDKMSTNVSGEGKLDELIIQKAKEKDRTLTLITSRREERLEQQLKLEDLSRENKELRRQHRQMVDATKEEEVKINRLDVELENRLTHLREEYMLSFDAAKEKYPLTLDIDEAKRKVKLIKMEIEELGTVNLGAIEEYERVSERYQFLTEQKNDLMEAKNTLHQIIDEMDEEMRKRFEHSFFSIKAEFEQVFKELFGGGRADLVLTAPEDLLNTGVDIVAQPPGKKLQNLGLLSGGERALTAIALLFAILRVRPVPFCVLDEVEAALDDANVSRFAAYLKQFSKETQFIVITHRKGTMEEADVLYGVTMQESGISKLVSVRLEESKQLIEG